MNQNVATAAITIMVTVTYLSLFGLILAIFREEIREDVAAAGGNVDQGPLLAKAETS